MVSPQRRIVVFAIFVRIKERKNEGYQRKSDKDEQLPKEERKQVIEKALIDEGITQTKAELLAAMTINDGLKLLLMAWARYEDEQPEGKRKQDAQDARIDWGRLARRFLENEE